MVKENGLVILKEFEEKIVKKTHWPHEARSALNWPDTPENKKELEEILKQFKSF